MEPDLLDQGIYLEPRTEDGRHPHPAFKILWMTKRTKADVQTGGEASGHWTAIARASNKWSALRWQRHSITSTARALRISQEDVLSITMSAQSPLVRPAKP